MKYDLVIRKSEFFRYQLFQRTHIWYLFLVTLATLTVNRNHDNDNNSLLQ